MIEYLEKKRLVSLTLTVLITIEIFYFSSLTGSDSPGIQIPFAATAYHFTVFFLFSFFLLATIKGDKKLTINHLLLAITLSLLHSLLDEFHQIFTPGRDSSIRDIIINNTGILASVFFYSLYEKGKNLKLRNSKKKI
jgi:VanZ family protein